MQAGTPPYQCTPRMAELNPAACQSSTPMSTPAADSDLMPLNSTFLATRQCEPMSPLPLSSYTPVQQSMAFSSNCPSLGCQPHLYCPAPHAATSRHLQLYLDRPPRPSLTCPSPSGRRCLTPAAGGSGGNTVSWTRPSTIAYSSKADPSSYSSFLELLSPGTEGDTWQGLSCAVVSRKTPPPGALSNLTPLHAEQRSPSD